jgi:predicted transcriptional regulator
MNLIEEKAKLRIKWVAWVNKELEGLGRGSKVRLAKYLGISRSALNQFLFERDSTALPRNSVVVKIEQFLKDNKNVH